MAADGTLDVNDGAGRGPTAAEPLVVQFRPEGRQNFQRRASQDSARRGRAAIALATLVALLVLVPWLVVNVVQGFEPRSLVLLVFLVAPAALVVWGWRKLEDRPPVLGAVAFVVTPDEIQFEPLPSANSALPDVAADVWPTGETTAEIRPSRVVGDRVVLRRPGARRRVYLAATLDTPAEVITARLPGV